MLTGRTAQPGQPALRQPPERSCPSASGTRAPGTDRPTEQTVEPTIRPVPVPVPAAADPVGFVRDYYALLPEDTAAAFALLGPAAQAAGGGRAAFEGFYARMATVDLENVRAVGVNTVEATVVFVERAGPTTRDPYRFVISTAGGQPRMVSFTKL